MKQMILNRKGFTLVELLAVIIILAIVVGITIPTVLTTSNSAKKRAFQTTSDTIAEWVYKQYSIISLSSLDADADVSSEFTALCGDNATKCLVKTGSITTQGTVSSTAVRANDAAGKAFLTAAGVKPTNYYNFTVSIDSTTGNVCIKIGMATDGEYYYGSVGDNATYASSSCSLTAFTNAGGVLSKAYAAS